MMHPSGQQQQSGSWEGSKNKRGTASTNMYSTDQSSPELGAIMGGGGGREGGVAKNKIIQGGSGHLGLMLAETVVKNELIDGR